MYDTYLAVVVAVVRFALLAAAVAGARLAPSLDRCSDADGSAAAAAPPVAVNPRGRHGPSGKPVRLQLRPYHSAASGC